MTTDNRFALLSVEDEGQTSTKKTQTQKKQTGPTQMTPAERAQLNAKRQKNKPPTQNKPQQSQDDTGFVTVQSQTKKQQGPQRMNRDSYFKEKSMGRDPIQNIPESPVPQRGDNSFRSRGGKTRTPKRQPGQVEDVQARSLNKPDFIPGGTRKFNNDRPPKSQGGSGNVYRGGNKGNKGGNKQGGNRQGKRQYDRHSGTGLNNAPKKNEAGGENWGDAVKEQPTNPEELKKVVEESSESSEYYPEPDEKGEEKDPKLVRKGFSSYVQKLEEEKANIQQLLEKHGVKKEKVEIKANVPESVSNINKKEKTTLAIEDKNDALFIKTNVPQTNQTTQTEGETKQKKKFVATSELGFRNKKHRGINRPLEELPPRQPRPQRNQNQNVSDKKDNTNVQQTEQTTQTENKEQQQTQSPNQNRGTGNFRGKQGGRGGKGGPKRIFSEDFPSLSGDIVVGDKKPQWVQQQDNN